MSKSHLKINIIIYTAFRMKNQLIPRVEFQIFPDVIAFPNPMLFIGATEGSENDKNQSKPTKMKEPETSASELSREKVKALALFKVDIRHPRVGGDLAPCYD